MSFKHDLIWLKGRKVLVCEPNDRARNELCQFLGRYQIQVEALASLEQMHAEIEKRRYATRRVYVLALIEATIARDMQALWQEVIFQNPMILGTPLGLMSEPNVEDSDLKLTGFFRYYLAKPVTASQVLRVLRKLNRWKTLRQPVSEPVSRPAQFK